jgi:hypothetical protein
MNGTYRMRKRKSRASDWLSLGLLAGALALPSAVLAQAGGAAKEEDELGEEEDEKAGPGTIPAEATPSTTPPPAGPQQPPTPPAATPPPAAPPSPFTFILKGQVAGTVFMQDVPFGGAIGGSAIFGPSNVTNDKWMWGGDVRQSRLTFIVKGPPVLGDAMPTGVVEFDLLGGQQINSVGTVPLTTAPVTMNGMPTGAVANVPIAGSAYGDESILPRLRIGYVELAWNGGLNILRVGQFHNLLLPMIAASAAHTGTPLGYGAGQLGWRSPGITYLHRVPFSADTFLDVGLQLNRNSWIDSLPLCTTANPPAAACLPNGISTGEASSIPQVEARLMLSGGKAPSPWPYYAPNVWQLYAVGHWDVKDLSGLGYKLDKDDTLTTLVGEVGFKLHLGPILLAANGYYGKNSANVFGNLVQFQAPQLGAKDVNAFGAWAQIGFNITEKLSIWAFGGIDKPKTAEAQAAGFTRMQNLQFNAMIAWSDGPVILAAELFAVATDVWIREANTTITNRGIQPSMTLVYNF